MVEGVHTNKAMAVSLLNDCVMVGDTVGMVVVAVCCGMDVVHNVFCEWHTCNASRHVAK